MNKSGNMIALKNTYEHAKQFELGSTKLRDKEIKTAYACPKKIAQMLQAHP